MKSFGLTIEAYDAMLAAQGGGCAICKSPDHRNKKSKYFCVDHCHKTNKVRGLLCNDCNVGIGRLGDSAERIRAALDYLLH